MINLIDSPHGLGQPRMLVVGDVMLDRYTWGEAERVSPEAPVLVLRADSHEARLGGAGSVAFLLGNLDAEVTLAGVVGDDPNGRIVSRLLADSGIGSSSLLIDSRRLTTSKERFLGRAANRHAHQILRVDSEDRQPLRPALEERLAEVVIGMLANVDALLIADYAKGTCTPRLLATLISAAVERGKPVFVDPARIADYSRYRNASLVTPNRIEAELASGRPVRAPQDAEIAGRIICSQNNFGAVLVKLDSDGMVLVEPDGVGRQFATRRRAVYDVTGAGDMVLAMVCLCRAAGMPWDETVQLANVAAGLEVEKLGVAPVSWAEIRAEVASRSALSGEKVVSADRMAQLATAYRSGGRSVVFTNGCFDLLHAGHVSYLEAAARLGDVLVVGLNSDASVRRLKGWERPVIPEASRAALLAALACVDHVVVFEDDTPHELLRRLRPDILVKGGTYTVEEVVGREVVHAYGGKVCVTGKVDGISTSEIIARLRGGAVQLGAHR
jgi:D-beta-D-heptose 7-phosphate kinase/D-beta-D-heptose 1-phosphate adenosyltransferase